MSTIEPRYLDPKQAAAYLTISVGTLAHMRVTGDGPPYAKSGRRVIYAVADLDTWVEERKRRFTGETPKVPEGPPEPGAPDGEPDGS